LNLESYLKKKRNATFSATYDDIAIIFPGLLVNFPIQIMFRPFIYI